VGSLGVVEALEEPECARGPAKDIVGLPVVDRGDGADNRRTPQGYPQPAIGGAPERIASRVDALEPVSEDRLDPVWVVAIDDPCEPEVPYEIRPGVRWEDPQGADA